MLCVHFVSFTDFNVYHSSSVTFSPVWFSPVFILLYITNHRPPLLTFFYSDIIKTSSSPLSIIFRSGTCVEYERRCDERLRAKAEGSTRLTYTGLRGGLEHLKYRRV